MRKVLPVALAAAVILVLTTAWALTAEQEAKLLASDGGAGDYFGYNVAFDGGTAIIGAFQNDGDGVDSGAAYVFVRQSGIWNEMAKLLPTSDYAPVYALFGRSVALDGDTAVIGATGHPAHGFFSGSAYVFTRSGGVWSEQAELLASDGATNDYFGVSVAVDGNVVLVGATGDDDNGSFSGSAYVFARTGDVWTEQAKLLASDGAAGDLFGVAIALDGDTAVIGAQSDDDNGSFSGSAYVFTRSGGVWSEQAKLLPSDGRTSDFFGKSVALDGESVLIGAPNDDDNGFNSGSVYVFSRTNGVWTEQSKLLASEGDGDHFGVSIASDGDTAVIGAYEVAYVFTRAGGEWTEATKLPRSDVGTNDYFGQSVSLDGDVAVVGAPQDDDNGEDSGSAYVFRLIPDDDGDGGDGGVPAVGGFGAVLSLLAVVGIGIYFLRRGAH